MPAQSDTVKTLATTLKLTSIQVYNWISGANDSEIKIITMSLLTYLQTDDFVAIIRYK